MAMNICHLRSTLTITFTHK